MTPSERNTLLFLFGLGVIGHGARILALAPEDAPGGVPVLEQLRPADLGAHRARVTKAARPLAVGERIDLNQAPAEEIARLPRIGLVAARNLVRAREEQGGFASFDDLDRLPGVGPGLLAAISDHVTLGDTARARRRREEAAARGGRATQGPPPPAPGAPVIVRQRPSRRRPAESAEAQIAGPIDLNRASESDLISLPGIGSTRAKAILAYRQTNGPFASVADLEKVPGLPRRLVRELASQVVIR